MSQDKQMKAVSPLLQQVINISSIVGGVGSLIFCIWAYQAGILQSKDCLLYTSPSPRDRSVTRMPSSA